jgi:transketolase
MDNALSHSHEEPSSSRPCRSYGAALAALAAERHDVVVMAAQGGTPLAGVDASLGVRFIDVASDDALVSAAAGQALRGRMPVVHASEGVLAQHAFELCAWIGSRRLPVTLVGFQGAMSNAAVPTFEDVALMRAVPGLQVFCPADRDELLEALPVIVASGRPAYVRYTAAAPALAHLERFAIGRAEVVASEDGVSILSCGSSLGEAESARRRLAERGVPVRLVNLRSLEPLDEGAIVDAVRPAELVVTLESGRARGGLHTLLAEVCLKHRLAPWALALGPEGGDGVRLAARILDAVCSADEWTSPRVLT